VIAAGILDRFVRSTVQQVDQYGENQDQQHARREAKRPPRHAPTSTRCVLTEHENVVRHRDYPVVGAWSVADFCHDLPGALLPSIYLF
jgi:hypothetical protein